MSARRAFLAAASGVWALSAATILSGCHTSPDSESTLLLGTPGAHSSSIVVSDDDARVFVVNPDCDSVSILDATQRTIVREIALADAPPAPDPTSGAFTPAVMPRTLALSPDGLTLYVVGERAGRLFSLDVASGAVKGTVAVGSEPIAVVTSRDGAFLFVTSSQDGTVTRVDAKTLEVDASVKVPAEPWALGWSSDGAALFATHLMGPGVTAIDPTAMTVTSTFPIPDTAPRGDKRLAHGQVRAIYDVAARPGTDELWAAHAMLGTDTAQPDLDFESTAFPSLSLLHSDGRYEQTLSTDAEDVDGVDGAFLDVVSGPHAIAFTADGDYALVVDTNSEDVLVVDARARVESSLVRPLPGHMQEGIALSHDGKLAYVDERNTSDVAVLALDRSTGTLVVSAAGAPIPRVTTDPMPATLRLGQHLFYSANSDEYAITKDHWVACSTCHSEGRTDAVTWKFVQGPRDTPSNAGGTIGTGFLFRTADRNRVEDYWQTIDSEQGGHFDPMSAAQAPLLAALASYVNYAIPLPIPPTTDPQLVAAGASIFSQSGCPSCHSGPRLTDSGSGNPTLDLKGMLTLHDVGTCVSSQSGAFPDADHEDIDGDPRSACNFDTPSLQGVASSPPYLHDGSAKTLQAAVETLVTNMNLPPLSSDDEAALVEYLRSL